MLTSPRTAVRRALSDVATAIECLHTVGWTHRDVKPDNIITTERGAVLIDYSESAKEGQLCPPWTTPKYAPPELLRAMDQGTEAPAAKCHDYWPYGSTVLAALQGNHRMRGERIRGIVARAWTDPSERISPRQVAELLENSA